MSKVVIAGAKRTALGALLGQFTGVPATQLGSTAIQAAVEQSGVAVDKVDEVIMGCVLPAGLGQAPARQAALGAGLPVGTGCTTINKVCGSGMKAIMMGHDLIKAGSAGVVVAGGMESMTNAPHLLMNSRTGTKFGNTEMLDHMAWDGLVNPYDKQAMGVFGEMCADKYTFTREQQDAYAAESVRRALAAQADGSFKDEIAPVTVSGRKGDVVFDTDEQPGRCNIEKIPTLRPAFKKDGTITAAASSSINDGAAAVVLASEEAAKAQGLAPIATIVAHATHSQEPEWFTTAPVSAIQKVLDKAGWKVGDVDLFEVNEAFSSVVLRFMQAFDVDHDKLNVNGGAIAMGHPLGATGAIIIGTLLDEMERADKEIGLATLCIASGMGAATIIERV